MDQCFGESVSSLVGNTNHVFLTTPATEKKNTEDGYSTAVLSKLGLNKRLITQSLKLLKNLQD